MNLFLFLALRKKNRRRGEGGVFMRMSANSDFVDRVPFIFINTTYLLMVSKFNVHGNINIG